VQGVKPVKKLTKALLIIITCVCCAALLLVLIFALPGMIGGLVGCIEQQKMRSDVFEFVLGNKDTIEVTAPHGKQAFHYNDTGSWDTSVYFGYYYSAEDNYLFIYEDPLWGGGEYGSTISPNESRSYKKGIRIDGIFGDSIDWYYTEKICDNWYYYELHDG